LPRSSIQPATRSFEHLIQFSNSRAAFCSLPPATRACPGCILSCASRAGPTCDGGGLGRGVSRKVGACGYPPLQLSPARGERADCFARNDVELQTRIRIPRREAPEWCMKLSPNRGRGERRMPVAPAVSCALVVIESTRVTTSTPESPGVPARNGFNGFLRALPGDRALLPPSSAD
jgi:hypothetical protein